MVRCGQRRHKVRGGAENSKPNKDKGHTHREREIGNSKSKEKIYNAKEK